MLSVIPSLVKSQAQLVGLLVLVSLKDTDSGTEPEVGDPVKLATGAAQTKVGSLAGCEDMGLLTAKLLGGQVTRAVVTQALIS